MSSYNSVKEVSQDINKVAETAEYLKNLYYHRETVDEKSILAYEQDFSNRKFKIVSWLEDESNFDTFKVHPEAKQALLYKITKDGLLDKEFGLDPKLQDKIYRDFNKVFENTPSEELLTLEEKKRLQHYTKNSVPEENRHDYSNEHKHLCGVFAKGLIFVKSMEFIKKQLPHKDLLPKDANDILSLIEKQPHFVQGHPNNFLARGQSFDLKTLNETIHDSATGTPDALEKLKSFKEKLNEFVAKIPTSKKIKEIRDESLDNKNTNNISLKL